MCITDDGVISQNRTRHDTLLPTSGRPTKSHTERSHRKHIVHVYRARRPDGGKQRKRVASNCASSSRFRRIPPRYGMFGGRCKVQRSKAKNRCRYVRMLGMSCQGRVQFANPITKVLTRIIVVTVHYSLLVELRSLRRMHDYAVSYSKAPPGHST